MLTDLNHKRLLGNLKSARNSRSIGVFPSGREGDSLAIPRVQDPRGLGLAHLMERLLTLQLANCVQGALGPCEVPVGPEGAVGRADEPTSIPSSRAALHYLVKGPGKVSLEKHALLLEVIHLLLS